MPRLLRLAIHNFRNLSPCDITFSPHFNLFYGQNGSGKSSLLEAIYYLGLGKSFRTSQTLRLIQHHCENFTLFARLSGESTHQIGVERTTSQTRTVKLDGNKLNAIAPLTKLLPLQFMSPLSYRFFHDGPKIRRQFLDWALFHVEPSYLQTWQSLQKVLKQRNRALKMRDSTVAIWDTEFVTLATTVDLARQKIFEKLRPLCAKHLKMLLPNVEFKLEYQRGWSAEAKLHSVLQETASRDRQLGYTYFGPQRADLQLYYNAIAVQDMLSQGQQKLAAYALHLALGTLLQQETAVNPVYLIDDLPSELDAQNRSKIIQTLASLDAQVFITGLSKLDLNLCATLGPSKLFHVEHGTISETNTCAAPLSQQSS